MKRLYRRYFVLLDAEDKGYGLREGNTPKGYAKIEVRNDKAILGIHCQNIKRLDEKNERYRIYLVKVNDIKSPINVELGLMEVDDRGNSEAVFEFNAENVKASRVQIDDFDAITVLVEKISNKGDVIAPLVGYVHKEKANWKSAFSKSKEINNLNTFDVKQPKEVAAAPLIFEKRPEKKSEDIKVEEKPITEVNNSKNTVVEVPAMKLEDVNIKETISPKPLNQNIVEQESINILNQQYSENNQGQNQANHIQYYIESTLKLYPKVNPFENNLPEYEWWQIYHNQQTIYRAYMPFIAYLEIMNNPNQYHYPYYYPSDYYRLIYMYQHYLFGICYDEQRGARYFVYAIPGRKVREEQPFGGSTGFVHWKACIEKHEEGIGYWMLHIDPVTGLVVEPLEKTKV